MPARYTPSADDSPMVIWPMVIRRLALLAAVVLMLAPSALAQAAYEPQFEVDPVTVRGADGAPALDVYVEVPYQNLRFLARTGGFEAEYAVTLELYAADADGQAGRLVTSRTFDRAVAVPEYADTQDADRSDRALQSLAAVPGDYVLEVSLEDAVSARSFSRELAVGVRPLDGAVALSDILLLDDYEAGGAIVPRVGGAVATEQEAFTVYYELYAEAPQELVVSYVITETTRTAERPSFRALLNLAPSQQQDLGTPLALREPVSVPEGRSPATLRVETEAFKVGDYQLDVRLETPDGELVAEASRRFPVRWLGLDAQIADIDEAIAQLRYVAKDRELRAMRDAETDAEKMAAFRAFWTERDPTPGTARNERLEEYYYRVAYANERYSRLRDSGWDTDRGEIFITFGEPDFVEVHPFNYGTQPYQVWYYYRNGRRFLFVDETGGGDFQLLWPVWDDRTRL